MKDSEIERLDMHDRIKVIGCLETARQILNSLLGKKGTLEDISFNIHGIIYTVPAGFVSDGCSLPRVFWRIIGNPLQADWVEEAVLHDWLYKFQPVSRREADKIFFIPAETM